jgi:hypothetical protein
MFKSKYFQFIFARQAMARTLLLTFLFAGSAISKTASSQTVSPVTPAPAADTGADRNESERSDKLTGGHIETADFEPDAPDIRLTLNVPTFRLTLWQTEKK